MQRHIATRAAGVIAMMVAACYLGLGAARVDPPAKPDPAKKLTIAVIPKGTTHVYWKGVEAGAKQAGEDLGVEIIWKGPLTENDRAQQIQVMQQFVTQGVDGIVLAPLDHKALAASVKSAADKKIPVSIIDSSLDGTPGTDFAAYVATNNRAAGKLGGAHLAKLMDNKGGVVLMRYMVGSSSTDDRENGFLDAVKPVKDIQVLVDSRYAGVTAGEAKSSALAMMDQIKAAGGVFCPNESTTLGLLLALRQTGMVGKVHVVGFDSSPPLIEALKKGEIDALVVQNPRKMGYKGVEAVVKTIRGEKIEKEVDTGAVLVTKDNLESPEVQQLLK